MAELSTNTASPKQADQPKQPNHGKGAGAQDALAQDGLAQDALTQDGLARVGVALADPVRRTVLLRLSNGPAYPVELAELCATSRSNMSNHLTCLRGCGLIVAEREGRRVRYEIVSAEFAGALRALASVPLATICEQP